MIISRIFKIAFTTTRLWKKKKKLSRPHIFSLYFYTDSSTTNLAISRVSCNYFNFFSRYQTWLVQRENRFDSLVRTDESAILLTEVATMLATTPRGTHRRVNVMHDSPRQKSTPLRKQLTFVLILIPSESISRAFRECCTRKSVSIAARYRVEHCEFECLPNFVE